MAEEITNRDPIERLKRTKSVETEQNNQFRDVLPMYLDDFLIDFELQDILIYVNCQKIILTEEDMHKLSKMKNEAHRIILIFYLLVSKNKDIVAFVETLRKDYPWLYDKLYNGVTSYRENKDIIKYLNLRHELRSRIPKHVDINVRRIELFAETRNFLKELKPWHYLVIHGELGYGKKWLALDVCSDYSVIKAMDFKIYWLDVHSCDSQEKDLEKLQRLKIMLGGPSTTSKIGDYEGISNKILELQQDLKTILKQDDFKDCLLVLADVQNIKTIEAFALPCKILVTTRNKKIMEYLPNAFMKLVNIDRGLTSLESEELFERVLDKDAKTFPTAVNEIIEYSKSHPFLLNIIAQRLKSDPNKWEMWATNLQHFKIQNDKIHTVIKLSLNVLRDSERDLFNMLAIFYHSVKIPLSVLANYWEISEHETEILIKKFDRYSLVTRVEINGTNAVAIMIHILYYNYLQNCINGNRAELHQRLIRSYRIEEALQNRTDINLSITDDHYFYYYVGYHLKEAQMTHLFPKLYLDLGFLGQKLRNTGLPNTIGDLKYFRNEITDGDPYKEDFIDSLHEFLPNIEEMIFKSDDTFLMQYTLMTNDPLHEEAMRQASAFPHHVWFNDSDHFHRRRQIVPLREEPKLLKLLEPNTCLVALENHSILVADLSLNYSHKPTLFADHRSAIQQIVVFTDNFFLSFDSDRNICVWSIQKERRESLTRRESLRFVVNQIDYSTCMKVRQRSSVQIINGYIQAFFVEKENEENILLHTALSDGAIQIQKWNSNRNKFESEAYPPLQTNIKNMKFLLLLNHLYVILTKDGRFMMFNSRDGSQCSYISDFDWKLKNPINLHYYRVNLFEVVMVFVYSSKVFQVRIPIDRNANVIRGTTKELYKINDEEQITCSAMSDDGKYLIIGTKQGILVLDLSDGSEVLRNSISDCITCVDTFSLDDEIYKYIIISASKNEKQLNIFGLKLNGNDTLTWANSIGTFVNECNLNLRFEPTAWLVGKQLFDVILDENRAVVAVDSKNRIHYMLNTKWTTECSTTSDNKITAIKAFEFDYYYGCQNGMVYNSNEKEFDFGLKEPIRFLEVFGPDYLVVSTDTQSVIKRGDNIRVIKRQIHKCYMLDGDYLLFVEAPSSVRLCNPFDTNKTEYLYNDDIFTCADFKQNVLVIGARPCTVLKNKVIIDASRNPECVEQRCGCNNFGTITAIEISSDADICAIGFNNGLIEIRKLETWLLIQQLESHRSRIYDMKFSPWTNSSLPIILASISEQICFWNVTHAVNNPLEIVSNGGRHSSRFSSRKDKRRSTDLSASANRDSAGYDVTDMPMVTANFWSNKKGPKDKPELLSCIKFAGNKAEKLYANEKFTEFVTIDDEGEIYFFKVKELAHTNGFGGGDAFNDLNGNVQI